jgi:DNA gyrase/topoisomerase IV subunit A
VRRRTAHRLAKLQARDHLVQGLLAALRRVDDIIHMMKTSKDATQARDELTSSKFGFSAEQVLCSHEYIHVMRVRVCTLQQRALSSWLRNPSDATAYIVISGVI